ncbi:MAG: helix-turn-helix domain-containing protein [Mesorhizobium sp.]|nr:helix-turn-helix domain-containing protein [Mesorhizobium sp.]
MTNPPDHPDRAQAEMRGRPGRKPSPQLRGAIIASALARFAERGVDSSTTREIALSAGTTERTLFKHFGSKEGLVQAVVEKVSIDMLREASFARIGDPRPFSRDELTDWHRAFLTERIEAAVRTPQNYRVLFGELLRDDGFRSRYGARWRAGVFEPFAAHLARMQANRQISAAHSPAALAGLFYSQNLSYLAARFVLAPDGAWSTARDVEAIVTLFRAACGTHSA